ncbi:hypothetical protein BCR39DRAFT_529130 [Naematelia encephala]|uniref:Phorbol-ester/DAG-type domain-containing protein n=1 Tax=Naematelia encephala TaxID=71784 RepID=A0A1Y2B799_9TREE|nr:hypothetical protein BCR39DRAFT_529130 [Naematelia encephala]
MTADYPQTLGDARRTLGVRPGVPPRQRVPQIHLEDEELEDVPPSPTSTGPPSPRTRTLSAALPPPIKVPDSAPLRSPTSPLTSRGLRRLTEARQKVPQGSTRGLYETRKLLAHLIDRLENRELAPDALDRAAIRARESSGSSKGKGKGKAARLGQAVVAVTQSHLHAGIPQSPGVQLGIGSEDLDDQVEFGEGDWDTDETYDLVEQTRDLLALAERQNLDLLSNLGGGDLGTAVNPNRTKRKGGRLSSLASPSSPLRSASSPDPRSSFSSLPSNAPNSTTLLDRMLGLLRSLMQVDCLHRRHRFSPLRPPNALQAACLDIATYLYDKCEDEIQVQVVEMVIEGIYGMGDGMGERLYAWIEGRLGELLTSLARDRGGAGPSTLFHDSFSNPFASSANISRSGVDIPTFAFSTDHEDEPPDGPSPPGWKQISPTSPTFSYFPSPGEIAGILSTHSITADYSPALLRTASLVPRLLLAIASTTDLSSFQLSTIHRVHRLLSLIFIAKPDASVDLLQLIAFGPAACRRTALEILVTFYPGSMGHNVIARRPATFTYAAHRAKWETGQDRVFGEDDIDGHHYVPWRISSRDGPVILRTQCATCQKEIRGFCVQCTLCHDVQHLACYQSPDQIFHYNVVTLSSRNSVPRSAHVKFSKCPPTQEEKILDGLSRLRDCRPTSLQVGQHQLHLINLFNLTMCHRCHEPLWGCVGQAYGCMSGCQQFFHLHCVGMGLQECRFSRDLVIDEVSASGNDPSAIDRGVLKASFEEWAKVAGVYPGIDFSVCSYDEVAISFGVLWTQYQLLKNGILSGSVTVKDDGDQSTNTDPLNLRQTLKVYEANLSERSHEASTAAHDFAHVTGLESPPGTNYFYSTRFLTYCTALLRAPSLPRPHAASGELLSPENAMLDGDGDGTAAWSTVDGAYELLDFKTVRRGLAVDLNIQDDRLAVSLLNHLRSAGLCTILSHSSLNVVELGNAHGMISFELPLLMDSSPTVELLVSAVEVLLDSFDLTLNEQAFSLLVRRAWPTLLCSPYALERLGQAVIAWIMAQDEDIHQIVKLYASKHRRLPGVRLVESKGSASVSVYKEDRKSLLLRYAQPWLFALHNQDPAIYAGMMYEQCKAPLRHLTSEKTFVGSTATGIAGLALERITHVIDSDVVFTALLDLLVAWLEDLGGLEGQDNIYKALPRLLRLHDTRISNTSELNLWQMAASTSADAVGGLNRVCRWMRVLAFSGVEIPWPTLTALVDKQTRSNSSDEARLDLVIAVNGNASFIEPERFAILCSQMFVNLVVGESSVTTPADTLRLDLMRQSLLLILRAFGVMLDDLSGTTLETPNMKERQPASLSKRRRMTSSINLLDLDEPMVLAAADILRSGKYPHELLLDFFWLLFTRATMVVNVDGFLHKIGAKLYPILWPLVELDVDRRSRARVFLRLLAVDTSPMERLVTEQYQEGTSRETGERLLVFVLDLADESLTYENLGWRRAAVGLATLFFEALLDAARVTPDALVVVKALLPAHLRAISVCFEEYLVQSSDERRLALLSRLRQFRLALPSWRVLSWRTIDELLAEQAVTVTQLTPARSSQTLSALVDVQLVRANLIAIGLEILASGLQIGWAQAQRFQQHTASACAPPLTPPFEGIVNVVFPSLRQVLDSSTRLSVAITQSSATRKSTMLVGSLFVPVVIDLSRELDKHDLLTQRHLLDIFMVTFYKQTVEPVELSALSTLQAIAEYVAGSECSENRLLGLQVIQTGMSRMEKASLARVIPLLFASLAPVLADEQGNQRDSAVLEQVRMLLRQMIQVFGRSGLFVQLFQNSLPLKSNSRVVAQALQLLYHSEPKPINGSRKASMIETMLLDLLEVFKRDRQTLQQVFNSLATFTNDLHNEITDDAAQIFGSLISRLSKHIAEWDAGDFDPDSMIRSSGDILEVTSVTAAPTLVHQISTFLHLCLARCAVRYESIVMLLRVSDRVANRETSENTIRTVLLEFVGSVIHGHQVATPTLHTLLHFLAADKSATDDEQQAGVLSEAAPGCVAILLRTHPSLTAGDVDAELVLPILQEAASILLKAEMEQPGTRGKALDKIPTEAASVQLGIFTYLLLAQLDTGLDRTNSSLPQLFPIVGRAMSLCLRACADYLSLEDAGGDGAEMLSLVFVVFRLVILASSAMIPDAEEVRRLQDDAIEMLWMRIWPDWSRLVSLSLDQNCVNGPLRAVVHSVLLDVIMFLAAASSNVLSRHLADLESSLGVLLESTDSPSSKMQKAMTALKRADVTEGMVDRGSLLATVKADLRATERLRALRAAT